MEEKLIFCWTLNIFYLSYVHMTTAPPTKKPFFSCCSAEEEKKEALVDLSEKKPQPVSASIGTFHPHPAPVEHAPTSPPPKIRFSYLNSLQQNQSLLQGQGRPTSIWQQ
jgi:hypothetical protein